MTRRMPPFRVGMGFDTHQFAEGRKLMLGGVEIPHNRGLLGHSDADVLLHAVCDAILGAVGEGDIGQHFPNSDPRWKDCPSMVFVRESVALATARGYRVSNIDVVILAEQPKIGPHVQAMRSCLAQALDVPEDCVGIKATTMETMGCIGREEGMVAQAVALLERLPAEDQSGD